MATDYVKTIALKFHSPLPPIKSHEAMTFVEDDENVSLMFAPLTSHGGMNHTLV